VDNLTVVGVRELPLEFSHSGVQVGLLAQIIDNVLFLLIHRLFPPHRDSGSPAAESHTVQHAQRHTGSRRAVHVLSSCTTRTGITPITTALARWVHIGHIMP